MFFEFLLSFLLGLYFAALELLQEVRDLSCTFILHRDCHLVEKVIFFSIQGYLALLPKVVGQSLGLKLFYLTFWFDDLARLLCGRVASIIILNGVLEQSIPRGLCVRGCLDNVDIFVSNLFFGSKQGCYVVRVAR